MPHFNPSHSKDRTFRLFEEKEKGFFGTYILPLLLVGFFFFLVRITMVAASVTFVAIPGVDNLIEYGIEVVKKNETIKKMTGREYEY